MRDHRISRFWSDAADVFHLARPRWMTSARCRTEGTDVFFHERYKHAVKVAKALCGDCPVVTDCLRFAIINEEVGVWGGMTTTERRLYARRHGAPQPGERIAGGVGGGEMAE